MVRYRRSLVVKEGPKVARQNAIEFAIMEMLGYRGIQTELAEREIQLVQWRKGKNRFRCRRGCYRFRCRHTGSDGINELVLMMTDGQSQVMVEKNALVEVFSCAEAGEEACRPLTYSFALFKITQVKNILQEGRQDGIWNHIQGKDCLSNVHQNVVPAGKDTM
ncbi:hypothetical protein NPIL_175181 [Nephila pilipes]|uniref:Uncharacterized protein n=1 Tax=Nephila pilipes TaxID=299642 RepID=A0A8X6U0A9_NEPPI|nr:hypothetical protein NPIL_175181 [Nephila pilipes]